LLSYIVVKRFTNRINKLKDFIENIQLLCSTDKIIDNINKRKKETYFTTIVNYPEL